MGKYVYMPVAFIERDEIERVTESTRIPDSFNGDQYMCKSLYQTVVKALFGDKE